MFHIIDEPNPDIASARTDDGHALVVQSGSCDTEGRMQYRYEIWIDGRLTESGDDLRTGVGTDHGPEAMLATLASFLGAAAESYAFGMRNNIPLAETENGDLFTTPVVEWAHQNSDELSMLVMEIEEPDSE